MFRPSVIRHDTHDLLPRTLASGKEFHVDASPSFAERGQITRTKRFQDYGSYAEIKIWWVADHTPVYRTDLPAQQCGGQKQ